MVLGNTLVTENSPSQLPSSFLPEWVAALFVLFQAYWFHKWTSCVPNELVYETAISEWSRALNGVTPEQAKDAIEQAKALDWPPSLPEFLKLCRKSAGVPTYLEAYENAREILSNRAFFSEAERNRTPFLHPAVELALNRMSTFEFRGMQDRDVDTSWRDIYEQAVKETQHKALTHEQT